MTQFCLLIGVTVATLACADADIDALAYSVSGTETLFAVGPSTGVVTTTATSLDYETATSHRLEVKVTDSTYTATTTIVVTVPEFISISSILSLITNLIIKNGNPFATWFTVCSGGYSDFSVEI